MKLLGSLLLLLTLLGGTGVTVEAPETAAVTAGDLSAAVEEEVLRQTRLRLQTVLEDALLARFGEEGAVLDVGAYFDGEGHIHMTEIILTESLRERAGEEAVRTACAETLGLTVPLTFGEGAQ